mmetsp:Transcript_26829/g.59287  ORF Transcript_26829/g.59287 Transcript_26829/m.59287 type:complete len:379 (-) Transcript_26829:171-1307(-)
MTPKLLQSLQTHSRDLQDETQRILDTNHQRSELLTTLLREVAETMKGISSSIQEFYAAYLEETHSIEDGTRKIQSILKMQNYDAQNHLTEILLVHDKQMTAAADRTRAGLLGKPDTRDAEISNLRAQLQAKSVALDAAKSQLMQFQQNAPTRDVGCVADLAPQIGQELRLRRAHEAQLRRLTQELHDTRRQLGTKPGKTSVNASVSEAPKAMTRSRSADALHSRVGSVTKDTCHTSVNSTPRPYAAYARTARMLQDTGGDLAKLGESWRPEPMPGPDRLAAEPDTSRQQPQFPARDGRTVQAAYVGVLGEAVQLGTVQRSRSVPRLLCQPSIAGEVPVRTTAQVPSLAIHGWQPMVAQIPLGDSPFRGPILGRQLPGP